MTAPYYQDDLVTLYHGDCLEVDDWLKADVLVSDPPYGMDYQSNWGDHDHIAGDADARLREAVLRMWGQEKGALIFGTWRVEKPRGVRQLIVWDKGESPGMGDLSLPWGPSHEDIYALGKTGFKGPRGPSVIRAKTVPVNNRPNHPTPKPIGLMEVLISKTVGVVGDPFAGSGATLIAARNLGRRAVGVEVKERYCEEVAKQLSQQSFNFEEIA